MAGIKNNHAAGVEAYDKVLRILEWGRNEWKDVSKDERGAVLEDTFVRGVRELRLDAHIKVYVEPSLVCTELMHCIVGLGPIQELRQVHT